MQRAPEQMVVDGGYISSNNIAEMAKRGIDFVPRDKPILTA